MIRAYNLSSSTDSDGLFLAVGIDILLIVVTDLSWSTTAE